MASHTRESPGRRTSRRLRPLALLAACTGLVGGVVLVANEGAATATAVPAGPDAAGVTWLCRPGLRRRPVPVSARARTPLPPTGTRRDPRRGSVPVGLRLLLRVSHRDRICSHVQHGNGGDAGPRGRGGGASVPFFPGVQRVGADISPADERVAGRGARQRSSGRPDLLSRACWLVGRTTWPTTTTAGRSCSSDTRRGRPTSSAFCARRSTAIRRYATGWCRPSFSGATSRSLWGRPWAGRSPTFRPVPRQVRPAA